MTTATRATAIALLILGVSASAWAQVNPAGSEFRVNTYTTGDQGYSVPDVASGAAGDFVVVWDDRGGKDGDGYGVFGQRYNSAGAAQGTEFQVNTYTTDNQYSPAVGADSAGNFVVVWSDGYYGGSLGRRFDSAGVAQGSEFAVGGSNSLAVDGAGKFVVVYQRNNVDGDGRGVFAERHDSDGTLIGSEFQVNTYTTNDQRAPGVDSAPSGSFVVVWRSDEQDGDGRGVFGQRFDSSGTPAGTEFQVNTYTTDDQQGGHVAVAAAGNFLVVWRNRGGVGNSGQRYNSSGAPIDSEFLTVGTGEPRADFEPGGGFVVAGNFSDSEYDGGIGGQRYDSAGNPLGPVFQVNTYTTGYQYSPQLAVDGSGNFVVVWRSLGQDGDGYGVFGQRFVLCGNGMIDAPETCDDGNTAGDDGCDEDCQFEGCFTCAGEPSTCTAITMCANDDGCCAPGCNDDTDNDCFAGQLFKVKDDASNPTKRKIDLQSRSASLDTTPGTGIDPATDGAYLQVYNNNGTGESVCISLPASGWEPFGGGADKGFKYKDKSFTNGPCKLANIKNGFKMKIKCDAKVQPINYSLDEPQQVSMGVNFISGGTTFCFLFDGASVTKDEGTGGVGTGKFKARQAPAAPCPVPPQLCPPVLCDSALWAGTYSGTYTGSEDGTWTATVDTDGAVETQWMSPSCGMGSGEGSLSECGGIQVATGGYGSCAGYFVTSQGYLSSDAGVITGSGTWSSSSGFTGTWTGGRVGN